MDRTAALEKVKLPAIGLIAVGALGAAGALAGAVQGATNQQVDQLRQAFDQAGMDPETTEAFVSLLAGGNLVMSLIALAVSGLILWSGLQMRQLKGRGLAIAGSILGMLPCFTGCCCVIGLPVGIWALVVLMNNEVKAAFEGQQG